MSITILEKTITQIVPTVKGCMYVCQCAIEEDGRIFRASAMDDNIESAMENAYRQACNLGDESKTHRTSLFGNNSGKTYSNGKNGNYIEQKQKEPSPPNPLSEGQRKAIYAECKKQGIDQKQMATEMFGFGDVYKLSSQQAWLMLQRLKGETQCQTAY